MARKKTYYKPNHEKKTIEAIIAKLSAEELTAVKNYIALDYELIPMEEKKTNTVEAARKELKGEELEEFNRIYKSKEEGKGFHAAMAYFNKKMKEKKTDK